MSWFRLGEFGVVVFFLCSGFIIPASIERHGSQSRFWVSRVFRLYPLYWTALGAVVVLHYGFARYPLSAEYHVHPVRMTAANATMVQDFLSAPLALGQSWSLAYELVFYVTVSALFVTGLHRRSAPLALGCFIVAAVVGTGRAVMHPFSSLAAREAVVLVMLVGGGAAAALWLGRRAGPQRWLAAAAVVVVVPLVYNRPEALNTAFFFLGTLFVGTTLYRWADGQLRGASAALVVGVGVSTVVVMTLTADLWWLDHAAAVALKRAGVLTYLSAYAVFLVALARREREFARVLIYLGTISYSLYLNHSIVMYGVGWTTKSRVVTVLAWVGISVAASAVTYRLIEKPAMDIGHRVGRRVSSRYQRRPDAPAARTAGVS
jgi:peptidoglycan/LPS O-acetylase OafA/YrhL